MKESTSIEVHNVSFGYPATPVLEHITFSVEAGDYLGIVGPNGGGKTTLLQIMIGLLAPTEGYVKIFGEYIHELKDRSIIGYVAQRPSYGEGYFPATVLEVVESGRTPRVGFFRRLAKEDKIAIHKALSITGVDHHRNRLIHELSGGERQRVFIARALAAEPKILFLDEPSAGVDLPSQEQFYAFLKMLNEKHGITIILVSHDIDEIAKEAKSVLCLNRGLVCHGTPEDFIKEEYLEKLYGKTVKFIHKH